MSDFGSFLTVSKKNGDQFSHAEVRELSAALEKILAENEFTSTLGDPFSGDLELSSDGREASVPLSEYYHGGDPGEDEEMFDFVNEVEVDDLQVIATQMSAQFSEYTFKGAVEEW